MIGVYSLVKHTRYKEIGNARVNIKLYLCVPLRLDNIISLEGGAD